MKVYIRTTRPNVAESMWENITNKLDFDTYQPMIQGFSFVTARTIEAVIADIKAAGYTGLDLKSIEFTDLGA